MTDVSFLSLKRGRPSQLALIAGIVVLLMSLLLGGAGVMALQASRMRKDADARAHHTTHVLEASYTVRLATLETMRGERGYLLTHDEAFLGPYRAGRAQLAGGVRTLQSLVSDNPAQSGQAARIRALVETHLDLMSRMVALEQEGRHREAVRRVRAGEGKQAIDAILTALDEFEAVERTLLDQRRAAEDRATRAAELYQYLLCVVGLVLLVVGVVVANALRRSWAREAAAHEELRQRATTDELTGLANRRELLASLDRMMASARRSGRPLSVAILDIDHFKRVNDRFGHIAGDEVIRRVAQMAVEVMRNEDLVGRLGGEEYVIVLPDTDAGQAMLACERLRKAIAATQVMLPEGTVLQVTLSSGIAAFNPEDDRTSLIARADEALYAAKNGGRDQVRLAA